VVPRVLMVHRDLYFDGPDLDDIEPAIADDGETALAWLRREHFDAVLLDLRLEPLDGWCVLAAVGSWPERAGVKPRLIAVVGDRRDIDRALALGADLCVMAGTHLHARALQRSTTAMRPAREEKECPQPPRTSSPRPTTCGVRA
jgi:CheY-like chemotaxis protein